MPTEVVLTGVTCRVVAESDPEVLVCTWRGMEVVAGTPIIMEVEASPFDDMASNFDAAMVDNDYEFP
jgi:hypothetical protein